MRCCSNVQLNELVEHLQICAGERALFGYAGIVDEKRDGRVALKPLLDGGEIGFRSEIGGDHFRCAACLSLDAIGKRCQPLCISRDENEVISALCEAVGVDGVLFPTTRR